MTQKSDTATTPEMDDPQATAYDRLREGEVPPFPTSNPRNATDETGMPRNPAVSHPLPSKGFPDNDGDMASAPLDQLVQHPDGTPRVIHHAGVVKPRDVPDSELPEDQRADEDYRTKYERDRPEAVPQDVSEPHGQPVDKYGYDLRKGADPDAQTTGDSNPDNPDRLTRSDRYLGEEDAKVDPLTGEEVSNAEDSATDDLGFPKDDGLPVEVPPLQAGAGGDGSTPIVSKVGGQLTEPYSDPAEPPVVRENSSKSIVDADGDVDEDGMVDVDLTPPDPEGGVDADATGAGKHDTRNYGKKKK
jgi:hypothetical protein